MQVISTNQLDKSIVTRFFVTHWGSPEMVISSGTFRCDDLDGFAVLDTQGNIIGLITYMIEGHVCEIISLDSIEENKGIGTLLVQQVEHAVRESGCRRIKLVTTNDNLHALGFYQKRGYHLVRIFPDAVEKERKMKPEIPVIADNGIPIRLNIQAESASSQSQSFAITQQVFSLLRRGRRILPVARCLLSRNQNHSQTNGNPNNYKSHNVRKHVAHLPPNVLNLFLSQT